MGMSSSAVRVINPVLSQIAQDYKDPDFVGGELLPRVEVGVSGGQVLEFGKEAFVAYNLGRAPGATTKRISFGYLGRDYSLREDAVEIPVAREHQRDAAEVPGVDLGERASRMAMKVILRGLEVAQAAAALDPDRYDADHRITLAGATKWSDESCRPAVSLEAGKEAIRRSSGARANMLLLSAVAFNALKENPSVIERFKYTSKESITAEMLAALLDIDRVVVGRSIAADAQGAFSDIWGNNAVLAYVPKSPLGQEEPSYGYTYTMRGHPFVEQPYWDPSAKAWIYGCTMERQPVICGIAAGYLFRNPA